MPWSSPGRSGIASGSSTRSARPKAQWALWNARPDPDFLADPRRGSPHSRGVAVDLTLLDGDGAALDMGTGFDAFTPLSHHACRDIPVAAQRNRFVLLGIMSAAGWDFYGKEWWHYQLFDAPPALPAAQRQRAAAADDESPDRLRRAGAPAGLTGSGTPRRRRSAGCVA